MKVTPLYPAKAVNATKKLIAAILQKNLDAFKATDKQFIRNNSAILWDYPGMIA